MRLSRPEESLVHSYHAIKILVQWYIQSTLFTMQASKYQKPNTHISTDAAAENKKSHALLQNDPNGMLMQMFASQMLTCHVSHDFLAKNQVKQAVHLPLKARMPIFPHSSFAEIQILEIDDPRRCSGDSWSFGRAHEYIHRRLGFYTLRRWGSSIAGARRRCS